jgi:hypothetical protein
LLLSKVSVTHHHVARSPEIGDETSIHMWLLLVPGSTKAARQATEEYQSESGSIFDLRSEAKWTPIRHDPHDQLITVAPIKWEGSRPWALLPLALEIF